MSLLRTGFGLALGALLALGLFRCAAESSSEVKPTPAGLSRWAERFPDAASGLCVWTQQDLEATKKIFAWQHVHPDRSSDWVNWTLSGPGASLDAFVSAHPYWSGFEWLVSRHRQALLSFMAWCRRHPAAARELIAQPDGVRWAARHAC